MIQRIYVMQKTSDSRNALYKKSWNTLLSSNTKGKKTDKIKSVAVLDSYLIDGELTEQQIIQSAEALTNTAIENYSINKIFPSLEKFDYVFEIAFMPGVTDNVGTTSLESIKDTLGLDSAANIKVYTSKIYAVKGSVSKRDITKIANELHNPLIESSLILNSKTLAKKNGFPLKVPEVILDARTPFINVSLAVSDEELIKIGKEGIMGDNGKRRGPLALDLESMKVIKQYFQDLGRDPKDIELESLAQTWSEHCKHTIFASPIDELKEGLYKTYIKGATKQIRKEKGKRDFCVSVFSDNAGGIVFDDDYLITHKVETHNSPSALDPFGGAITGIVGVNRDTMGFGLGAKPIANTYGFCFGYPDDARPLYKNKNKKNKMLPPKRIMDGVIKGVNVGGNTSGIPTVSGFVKYDDRYKGKPLVFVGTVGIIPRKINNKPSHEKRARPGDYVVMLGGRVGADGIHGATFSSVKLDSNSPATAVQIGDPITQKKMSDALIKEARGMDLYHSITDNGAGGLSCSVAEMAKECGGAQIDLDKVPLKYPGLQPWEIWISESQERMTLSVPKKKWEVFRRLMESRGVEATVIGEFTASGRCIVRYHGELVMDMELDFLHDGLPEKLLTTEAVEKKYKEPALPKEEDRNDLLLDLLSENNIAGFSFISNQYDHEVQASSVLKPTSGRGMINTDAQVFRPVLSSNKGVVLSFGVHPSYGDISAYDMSAAAIDTAVRNTIAGGGKMSHLAVLDNFCWCSSHEKSRLAELKDSVRACYDFARSYGAPFISGKDSMFNDFRGYDEKGKQVNISIPPTLLISAISVMPDLSKTVSPEFKEVGDIIYVLGDTDDELGAGEYYKLLARKNKNNFIGNMVPKVNAEKNMTTYLALEEAIEESLIASSLSVTSGGLAIALAKAALGGKLGAEIDLNKIEGKASSLDSILFSESQGRILVTVEPKNIERFERAMRGVSLSKIGEVEDTNKLVIHDIKDKKVINLGLNRLHKAYHGFSESMK